MWVARAGAARRAAGGRKLAACAQAQLRHAPARRRRGPAQHPGAARPRQRVEHPDLHSGRVRQAKKRLRAQSPSGLNRERSPWRPTSNRSSCVNCGGAIRRTGTAVFASGWSSPTRPWSSTWPGGPPPGCLRTSRRPTSSPTGWSGLISAIERFDLSREIKFETYAIMRIKGAIIDELRSMDWVPRSVRVAGAGSRAREREARAHAAARPDRQGDRRRAGDHRGRTQRVAAGHLALVDRRAGRAVERLGLLRRPGLADGHDRGSRSAGPCQGARRRRPEGPDSRRRSPSYPSERSS